MNLPREEIFEPLEIGALDSEASSERVTIRKELREGVAGRGALPLAGLRRVMDV